MTTPSQRLQAFFFQPLSATGFGLLRIAFGGFVFVSFLSRLPDVLHYYGPDGFAPVQSLALISSASRLTLLVWMPDADMVIALYGLLLLSSLFLTTGLFPRLTSILTFILLVSFHNRNPLLVTGGDMVLQLIGFPIMIAPGIRALSVHRLIEQWHHFRKHKVFLPHLTMPVWPQRLLLWQLIVLYVSTAWYKALGTTWISGSAVAITLSHPHFARFPFLQPILLPLSPVIGWLTLAWEFSWLLLLIPRDLWQRMSIDAGRIKRWILMTGLFFHLGIFLLIDAGPFSLVMIMSYLGLLTDEDVTILRRRLNRRFPGRIAVLFDGGCGLCRRSMVVLQMIDHLHRLEPVDFRDARARRKIAPDLSEQDLDRSLHIRFPDGRTFTGFDALRALSRHVPALWLIAPFLYLPGVTFVGRKVYARIAERRKRCRHGHCLL